MRSRRSAAVNGFNGGYQRRRPEDTVLYQSIETHWPAFPERAEEAGGLPAFIVNEFEAYLRMWKRWYCFEDLQQAWRTTRLYSI